jgi:gas vesicle protein
MSENNQLLDTDDIIVEQIPGQPVTYSAGTDKGDRLLPKLALGGLLGATLGVLAAALAHEGTTQRVNQTVKSVGNAVKGAAEGLNDTVKDVGNAVKSVAEGLNDTVKDVGEAAKRATEGVSDTVKDTVDAVKSTAGGVSDTVKDTVDSAKSAAEDVKVSANQGVKTSDKQKTYILVPMENE